MSAEVTTATEQPIIPATDQPAAESPASIDPNETPEAKAAREAADAHRRPIAPRIAELTRKHRETEREAAYWRQRAEAAETAGKPAAAAETEPTPDQFDDYGAYVKALTRWEAKQVTKEALTERDQTASQATLEETRAANWQKGVDAAKQAHPDYDDVMAVSDVPIADHVKDLLLDSDHGPRLAYFLDRHPDVADRLNRSTPTQAAREIGRIEATFTSTTPAADDTAGEQGAAPAAAKPAAAAAPKPRTTSAPAPVKPAGQGRSAVVPLEKQSMDQYVETRKAQGASWIR